MRLQPTQHLHTQLLQILLLGFCFLTALTAKAQSDDIQRVEMKHRHAAWIAEQLRPFAPPGAIINTAANQIFIQADTTTQNQLATLATAMDTPAQNLVIQLHYGSAPEADPLLTTSTQARTYRTQNHHNQPDLTIHTQDSASHYFSRQQTHRFVALPASAWGNIETRNETIDGEGFWLSAQLNNDQVTLYIKGWIITGDTQNALRQSFDTLISGKPGTWLTVYESGNELHTPATSEQQRYFSTQAATATGLYIRVEPQDP